MNTILLVFFSLWKKYLRPWSSRDQPNCLVPLFPASGKHNVSGKVSIWYWVCFDFYEPKIDLVLRMKVVGAKYFLMIILVNLIYGPCMFCEKILNKGTIGPVNLEHWQTVSVEIIRNIESLVWRTEPYKPSDLICLPRW